MGQIRLTYADVEEAAKTVATELVELASDTEILLYAIPRGGVPAAYLVAKALAGYGIETVFVDDPMDADAIIDDIVDSGATRETFHDKYAKPFYALIDKTESFEKEIYPKNWVIFPWETGTEETNGVEDNIRRIMQFIGEDTKREGLQETPARVTRALKHWFSGYDQDPAAILKSFEDGAEGCDEMVVVDEIPFFSHCEHHIAPIFGTATIAYIPNRRIIGLSKIPRLLEIYARRMQVQERLTNQVAEALMEHLQPLGCGVVIKARHFCMESRGIEKIGSTTVTSALRGVFKTDPSTRSEFLMLAHRGR
jgi:GTP cyclohydrolase I